MSAWSTLGDEDADDSALLMGSLFDDDDEDGGGGGGGARAGTAFDVFGANNDGGYANMDASEVDDLFGPFATQNKTSLPWERGPRVPAPAAPEEMRESLAEFAGLMNQGGTCYLNSLLQTLYLLPRFKKGMYALDPESELGCVVAAAAAAEDAGSEAPTGDQVQMDENADANRPEAAVSAAAPQAKQAKRSGLRELQGLFARLDASLERQVSTVALTQGAFEWGGSQAVAQHDVHELVTKLLERVHAELVGTSQASLVKDTFIGHAKENAVRCVDCGHTSGRETPFMTLFVNVDGYSDLEASLEAQYCGDPERLEGSNAYKCDACGDVTDKELSQTLTRLPPYLFLNLNRFKFNYNTGRRVKISTRFEFPTTLNVRAFAPNATLVARRQAADDAQAPQTSNGAGAVDMSESEDSNPGENEEDQDPSGYTLVGIISHAGTGYGGHYMCYLRVDALCPDRADELARTHALQEGSQSTGQATSGGLDPGSDTPDAAASEWQVVQKSKRKASRRRRGSMTSKLGGNEADNEQHDDDDDDEDADADADDDEDGDDDDDVADGDGKEACADGSLSNVGGTSRSKSKGHGKGKGKGARAKIALRKKKKAKRSNDSSWGTWFKFNDTQVHKVSTAELSQTFSGRSCAYLLVYSRKDVSANDANPIASAMAPVFWRAAIKQSNRELLEHWKRYESLCKLTKFNVHVLGRDAHWEDPFVRLDPQNLALFGTSHEVDIDARVTIAEARDALLRAGSPGEDECGPNARAEWKVCVLSKAQVLATEESDAKQLQVRHALAELGGAQASIADISLDSFLSSLTDASAHVLLCPAETDFQETALIGSDGAPEQVRLTCLPAHRTLVVWVATGCTVRQCFEKMLAEVTKASSAGAEDGASVRDPDDSCAARFFVLDQEDADKEKRIAELTETSARDVVSGREVFCAASEDLVRKELTRRDRLIRLHVASAWPGEDLMISGPIEITIDPESPDDGLQSVLARLAAGFGRDSIADDACLVTATAPIVIIADDDALFALDSNSTLELTSKAAGRDAVAEAEAKAAEAEAGPPPPLEPIQTVAATSEEIKFTLVRNNDPSTLSLRAADSGDSLTSDLNIQRGKPVSWSVEHSAAVAAMKQDALDALVEPDLEPQSETQSGQGEQTRWRLRLTNWAGEARDLIPEAKLGDLPDEEANAQLASRVTEFIEREGLLPGSTEDVTHCFRVVGGVCADNQLDTHALASAYGQQVSIAGMWRALGPPASCMSLVPCTLKDVLQDVRGADEILVERGKTPVDGIADVAVYMWNEKAGTIDLIAPEVQLTEREVQTSMRGALSRALLTHAALNGENVHPLCHPLALAVLADNVLLRRLEHAVSLARDLPTGFLFPKSLAFKLGAKATPLRVPFPIVLHPSRSFVRTKGKNGKKRAHTWLCELVPGTEGATVRSVQELAVVVDEEGGIPARAADVLGVNVNDLVVAYHDAKAFRWEILSGDPAPAKQSGAGPTQNKPVKKSKAKTKRDRSESAKRKAQHGDLVGFIRISDLAQGTNPGPSLFDTPADLFARKLQAEAAEKRKLAKPDSFFAGVAFGGNSSYGESELKLGGDSDLAFADFS